MVGILKKIELMHKLFGSGHPSNKCDTCRHFVSYTANCRYYKCEVYGNTSSEATDWRKKYPSCALWNLPYAGMPIIEFKKHMPKPKDEEQQIEGQMSIEDFMKLNAIESIPTRKESEHLS